MITLLRQRIPIPVPAAFLRCIFWFGFITITFCTSARALETIASVADGELRACQLVSVDSAWAVGDRGLILFSGDAGKHWEVQHQRFDAVLYAVCFSDELNGCVLGGTIEPYSHRSVGVVLTTSDGGKNWESMVTDLPRLIGAQRIGPGHILAWGDWSNYYQSALFESTDGGRTFSGRPTPCGHMQCAAVGPDGTVIAVDRVGKVHRSTTGLEFDSVDLPLTPFEPIRFCKVIDGVWWIGGEAGRLYRSRDGVRWESLRLPGNAADHSLYSLLDAGGFGNQVWISGQPGSIVWTTNDRGNTWTVVTNNNRTTINSISVLNENLLLTCGPMASIFASRNGGKAWWPQHQSGSRNAVLNISSTCNGVSWDLMASVLHESKRHASAIVLHDQCIDERSGLLPELASRFEMAGKSLGLAQARILPSMPVSNLYSGIRESDLGYYAETNSKLNSAITDSTVAPLMKRLVFEIRNSRPDVIVSNCSVTGNALEAVSANAVEQASAMAARRDCKVFSASSGIPDEAWETQRVVVRSTNSGFPYSPSMLLNSNIVLGSVMTSIKPLLEARGSESTSEKRYSYRMAGPRGVALLDSPLKGILLDQATQITERMKSSPRRTTIHATSQWFGWKQLTDSETGNTLTPDRVWDSKVRAAAKDVPTSMVSPVLLEIAIQCRRFGQWNRWQSALELLLEGDNQSAAAEAAYWELMMHTGSVEVKRMLENQLHSLEQRNQDGLNASATTLQQASPFARLQQDSSFVQPASFTNAVRRIPISTDRDLHEFTRLFSKWPDSFSLRRSEPPWSWLVASRYREMQLRNESANATVNLGRSYADFWPPLSPYLPTWNQVAKAERNLYYQLTAPPQLSAAQLQTPVALPANSTPKLLWTNEPPFLDGKADEAFWQKATQIDLRDPWAAPARNSTQVRLARDKKYLYVFSDSPSTATHHATKDRKSDSIKSGSDQIQLRIDLDRDYASWFELRWSASGESQDAVNDMLQWNPTWHIAMNHNASSWSAEIAIPLEQLTVGGDASIQRWTERVWAMSVFRSNPGASTQSRAPSISDRASIDDWFLLDLAMPQQPLP